MPSPSGFSVFSLESSPNATSFSITASSEATQDAVTTRADWPPREPWRTSWEFHNSLYSNTVITTDDPRSSETTTLVSPPSIASTDTTPEFLNITTDITSTEDCSGTGEMEGTSTSVTITASWMLVSPQWMTSSWSDLYSTADATAESSQDVYSSVSDEYPSDTPATTANGITSETMSLPLTSHDSTTSVSFTSHASYHNNHTHIWQSSIESPRLSAVSTNAPSTSMRSPSPSLPNSPNWISPSSSGQPVTTIYHYQLDPACSQQAISYSFYLLTGILQVL